jgi:hypothetical protein
VASTRVPADFRVLIWGTVAGAIAALLAPALAVVSSFYRPTPLRRTRSDSTGASRKRVAGRIPRRGGGPS